MKRWWLQTKAEPNWKTTAIGSCVTAYCARCRAAHQWILDDVREADGAWLGMSVEDDCDSMQVIEPGPPQTGYEKRDRINRSLLWSWEQGMDSQSDRIRLSAVRSLMAYEDGFTPDEIVRLELNRTREEA